MYTNNFGQKTKLHYNSPWNIFFLVCSKQVYIYNYIYMCHRVIYPTKLDEHFPILIPSQISPWTKKNGRNWKPTGSTTLPETNIAHENPIFPGKYHQNGGFSMAMLVSGSVMVTWWFGFRGSPKMKGIDCYLEVGSIPIESQTTGPQTTN